MDSLCLALYYPQWVAFPSWTEGLFPLPPSFSLCSPTRVPALSCWRRRVRGSAFGDGWSGGHFSQRQSMCESLEAFKGLLLPYWLILRASQPVGAVMWKDFPTVGEDEEERVDEGHREPVFRHGCILYPEMEYCYMDTFSTTAFHRSYLFLQCSSICTCFIPYVLVNDFLHQLCSCLESQIRKMKLFSRHTFILFFPSQSRNQISLLGTIYESSCSRFIFLLRYRYWCPPKFFSFLPRITENKFCVSYGTESRQVGEGLVWWILASYLFPESSTTPAELGLTTTAMSSPHGRKSPVAMPCHLLRCRSAESRASHRFFPGAEDSAASGLGLYRNEEPHV